MVVDIHKVITSNPITKGIMSPWGNNSKANSIRGKLFNKYTGPGNDLSKQVKFDPQTGKKSKFMINHLHQMIAVQCIMI